jgi:serine/threonine-protein kinase PpkA
MVEAASVTSLEIPGYRVLRELGEGGMARVFVAVQESLEREVAIKVLSTELVSDPEFCQRFLKEGRTLAQITHPHVVTIFDSGEHQGVYYMCMELIRGGTLEERIAKGELSMTQSIGILKQVAGALEWSHGKGLVHRDVKPANVLFRDERTAVLSDFGIAKSVSKNTTRMTAAGLAIGTPAYMSPEQAAARELTARSDQYSLGVMFYEMLTGKVPYDADTGLAIAVQHLQAPVPKLPEEHAQLQPVIDQMMAKDPEDRFTTLEELIVTLERAGAGTGKRGGGRTEILDRVSLSLPKPRPVLLAGIGAFFVLLAAGIYLATQQGLFRPGGMVTSGMDAMAPPPASMLDPATQQEVEKWLGIAQMHYDIGRLIEPPGTNALEAYQRVLELDANNAEARQGLTDIAGTYEELARESLVKGDSEETKTLVTEGLRADPEHPGLAQLRDQIDGG